MLFSQYRKRKSNNWLLFSCLINFQFEFLMQSFVFYFYNKMENEIQFVFCFSFSWDNWKTNYLKISRLMSKYLYGHFYKYDLHVIQNKFVSSQLTFPVVQWSMQTPRIICFERRIICLESSWSMLMFLLLAATFIFVLFF